MKSSAPMKQFNFFEKEGGSDKRKKNDQVVINPNPNIGFTINDCVIKEMHTLDGHVFLSSTISDTKKSDKEILMLRVYKNSILGAYDIFNNKIYNFDLTSHIEEKYLVAIGSDIRGVKDTSKKEDEKKGEITSIKIFDVHKCLDTNYETEPKLVKTINLVKTEEKGNIISTENITSAHLPVKGIECFSISPDFTSMAIGFNDGNVFVLTAPQNFIASKDIKMSYAKQVCEDPITNIGYCIANKQPHIVFSSKNQIYKIIITDKSLPASPVEDAKGANKKCLDVHTSGNKFIFNTPNDTVISEYTDFELGRSLSFDGNKKLILYFKTYLVYSYIDEGDCTHFEIYDPLNKIKIYVATSINYIIDAVYDNDSIYILESNKGGKKKTITRLKEKDNKEKFDIFYKKSFFEAAFSYAKTRPRELLYALCACGHQHGILPTD